MVATVLYTGLRISELVWDDVDVAAGVIHVRAELSAPIAARQPGASRRRRRLGPDIPLVAQLARPLSGHRQTTRFARGEFATARGTPRERGPEPPTLPVTGAAGA